MNYFIFIIIVIFLLLISFFIDKNKTISGFKKGLLMFKNIFVPFLNILILISLILFFVPQSFIVKYLGSSSGFLGLLYSAIIGSIALIPGFISYPIAASLIKQGASYSTVATFITTLMMVGVVTLPIEIKYFGKNVAIIRNLLNFVIAIVIGLLVGLIL